MSDALFLPRELFATSSAPATAQPAAALRTASASRRAVNFESGEAVAADLLKALAPATAVPQAPTERRRKPRPANARGVDLFIT
jgi:hypothetical protein